MFFAATIVTLAPSGRVRYACVLDVSCSTSSCVARGMFVQEGNDDGKMSRAPRPKSSDVHSFRSQTLSTSQGDLTRGTRPWTPTGPPPTALHGLNGDFKMWSRIHHRQVISPRTTS